MRKKIYFIVIFILLLIGGTYAYFTFTRYSDFDRYEIAEKVYINFVSGSSFNISDGFPESDASARSAETTNVTMNGKTIPVASNEMAFYITGFYESKNLNFRFLLNDGNSIANKTRLDRKFLKFDLIEYVNGVNDITLVSGMSYPEFIDTTLYSGVIKTSTPHYYKLRMWIDENLLISDTDNNANYAASGGGTKVPFSSTYVSVKVTCVGELV